MNRLAIFVEGYSELQFCEALINEIAGAHNVLVEQVKVRGGTTVPRRMIQVSAAKQNTGQRYYVLLVDCGADNAVRTRIHEEHQDLTNKGYAKIIGLRDVRPTFTIHDIPKLEVGLRYRIKTSLIPVEFVLAVMEIEAWFLAEASHFSRIHPSITIEEIKKTLGFDPANDDMAQRPEPRKDLNDCYAIGGQQYQKGGNTTTAALDYTFVYFELKDKIPYLKRLIDSIDAFLG